MTEVTVRPTTFTVSCFPEGHPEGYIWDIRVERRGPDEWAVCQFHTVADKDGEWGYEPSPSNRDDAFKARYRFDLETALALAERLAPDVVVNGMKPADVIAWYKQNEEADRV